MDAHSVRLLHLGLLRGGLLVTDPQARLGWSLGGGGADCGLTVPNHSEPGQDRRKDTELRKQCLKILFESIYSQLFALVYNV